MAGAFIVLSASSVAVFLLFFPLLSHCGHMQSHAIFAVSLMSIQ